MTAGKCSACRWSAHDLDQRTLAGELVCTHPEARASNRQQCPYVDECEQFVREPGADDWR